MRRCFSLLLLLSGVFALFSQSDYRSPVDFTIGLSGTFGEPRTNHFHTGIDIRTQQVTGKKIYAVQDGVVSRISVSPSGYGKALYVDHPDGHTSVYAHLKTFSDEIDQYVKKMQYERESFAINLFPERDRFPVKKGEVIAYSGNSGSSGGPHLHFEIRDTETEEPLNALAFGFKVEDKTPPTLRELMVIPKTPETAINESCQSLTISLSGGNGAYHLTGKDTVRISGSVCFGISAIDQSTGSTAGNGVYSITLYIDGRKAFCQKMDRLSFDNGRCVNSVLDYETYLSKRRRIQTTEVEPGNDAEIYETVDSNGVYTFDTDHVHEVKYELKDFFGNSSTLKFYVKSLAESNKRCPEELITGYLISWDDKYDFVGSGIRFYGDSGTFFNNFIFRHTIETSLPKFALAPVHVVGNENIPMKNFGMLSIKPDSAAIKGIDASKLLIVRINNKERQIPQSTYYENGYLHAKIRDMGKFTVSCDTIPPVITAVNISKGKTITNQKNIRVKIQDNLSGINTYVGKLNDEWILMDFDAKNHLLEYMFDEKLKKGKNVFTLTVIDHAGNSSELKMTLVY
ncbi:MAG: M23 family metallopeptidase [Bacteroidales bacterium]|nr:M23 family metallopeptidase [Bacteroidales bacterium]